MRVLLVNPPRSPHNAILDHAPPEALPFVHRKLIGPPLGLLTLAAALKADHDVEVLELKALADLDEHAPPPAELLLAALERFRPGLVGITVIASELSASLELLRVAKAWNPAVTTIAGGLHANLCPQDFADPAIDVLVPGPGAGPITAVARALDEGGRLDGIGGILLHRAGRLEPTSIPTPPCDPSAPGYPLPDRSHLAGLLSAYVVGQAPGPSTYVVTSFGCPYRCSFCSIWPQHGGRYLQREVEEIIGELRGLDEYPVVRLADANTLVNPDFARRLFRRIAEEKIDKRFIMDIRVDTAARNPDLIAELARGGLAVAICGFESFREAELKEYGKGCRPEEIEAAVRVFHDNGVLLRGNYLVRPDWDEEDFDALERFATRHPVGLAGYTVLTPMPGTELYREMDGEIVDRDPAKYNFFNCVLRSRLPLERFYERAGSLWKIRLGTTTI